VVSRGNKRRMKVARKTAKIMAGRGCILNLTRRRRRRKRRRKRRRLFSFLFSTLKSTPAKAQLMILGSPWSSANPFMIQGFHVRISPTKVGLTSAFVTFVSFFSAAFYFFKS